MGGWVGGWMDWMGMDGCVWVKLPGEQPPPNRIEFIII
jgi:hypothetical protein